MDWRREDSVYAAMTLAAAALVGFLIAGNFGLVPSPFGVPGAAGAAPSFPAFAARTDRAQAVSDAATRSPDAGPGSVTPSQTPDDIAPTAAFTTSGGTVVSATRGSRVSGVAKDPDSGVDRVVVDFLDGSGETTSVPADVTCEDVSRTTCTWTAEVPGIVGSYEATARVTDRSGNTSGTDPTSLTVVNLGGPVEEVTRGVFAELRGLVLSLLS